MTIAADTPLDQALAIMDQYGIGYLPVLQDQALIGLLTRQGCGSMQHTLGASNLPRTQIDHGPCLRVLDVMQRRIKILPQETPAHEAARLVWEEGFSCIVVMRDGKPFGMVSPANLLDVFIATIDREQKQKYNRLLVPTHFSTTANYAVRRSLELARQHEASLTLLHVRKRLSSKLSTDIDHASAELVTRLDTEDENDAMARLASLIPSDMVKVTFETVNGEPGSAIVKAAIRHRADLIVMGRSTRRSWWAFFGPNVSRQVLRRAPCPVLIVTEPTRYELVCR